MKGLKRIALATAVAAAPFAAQAELKAMNDGAMGDVTGQAGVTIELETKVDIGSVTYTDQGSLAMSGVHIGGGATFNADGTLATSGVTKDGDNVTGTSGLLDDLLIEVDVLDDGDAAIHVGNIQNIGVTDPTAKTPIDFSVGIEGVALGDSSDSANAAAISGAGTNTSTLLASNIAIDGQLAALDIRVDTATDNLIANVAFNIVNMDMDVDFLGIGIRGMSITGASTGGASYSDAGGSNPVAQGLSGQFAAATITIGKATGVTGSTSNEALEIGIPEFIADVNIDQTLIGGENIGSIAMDNLAITQTSMKVYGHADGAVKVPAATPAPTDP